VEGRPLDERELVRRARRGDAHAFEELVRGHWEVAFRVALLTAGSTAEAEDALQESLVKAWRSFGRFDPNRPLRPWLLQIVANESRNRRRSAGRRARLALRLQGDRVSGGAASSPETAVVELDERQRLLDALDELPDDARSVLVCRYLLGLSEQETAAAVHVRPGTVKSRASRALDRLREVYERG
jgi:RNA polymerase sigma-70 factor (ECF subfamily)